MDLPPGAQKATFYVFCSLREKKKSLLVFFLSVSDDMNQVLVVQVSGHIWGEGSEHLLHLSSHEKTDFNNKPNKKKNW